MDAGTLERPGPLAALAQVKAATGDDRNLDDMVSRFDPRFQAMRAHPYIPGTLIDDANLGRVHATPAYSASQDDALALADALLPGVWWIVSKGKLKTGEPLFGAQLLFGWEDVLGSGEHDAGPALAILAATFAAIGRPTS